MDKNTYYIYNNEAIACCILFSVLRIIRKIDYSRYALILPFMLDDKTVNKLIETENINIYDFIKNNIDIFGNFNQRYVMLMPIMINSSIMLNDFKLIQIAETISVINDNELNFSLSGDRLNRILSVNEKFCSMISNIDVNRVYKILNIEL